MSNEIDALGDEDVRWRREKKSIEVPLEQREKVYVEAKRAE